MIFEFSVLAAFGALLCWAFGDFFIQRATRKIGDIETIAWIGLVGSIGLLPFVLGDIATMFTWGNFWLLLLLSVITFVYAVAQFEAFKRGKLSVVEMIIEVELPVTVMLGVIFLGETLTLMQMLLIAGTFFGISLIAMKPGHNTKDRILEKGFMLALFSTIAMAVVNFLTTVGSRQVSPLAVVWFPWVFVTVLSLAVISKRRKGIRTLLRDTSKYKGLILATGIFDTLAWVFFSLAVLEEELSITVAITESYPAIAMFLGIWLNKEKFGRHQYVGAVIALAASIAMGFLV